MIQLGLHAISNGNIGGELHIIFVASNGKGKAAVDDRSTPSLVGYGRIHLIRVLEQTTRQHGLLTVVKCDIPILLPVINDRFLRHQLVNRQTSLKVSDTGW
jgi:hypothetical protein